MGRPQGQIEVGGRSYAVACPQLRRDFQGRRTVRGQWKVTAPAYTGEGRPIWHGSASTAVAQGAERSDLATDTRGMPATWEELEAPALSALKPNTLHA